MPKTTRTKSAFKSVSATPYQVRRMADMARWIAERNGYRWLAKFTSRSFGYWQHIATRDDQCKPKVDDYLTLKRIYDIVRDGNNLDAEMVSALLDVMEHRGRMDASLARLLNLVRRRGGK